MRSALITLCLLAAGAAQAQGPSKVAVSASGDQHLASKIPVKVTLQDASNQPVPAAEPTTVAVSIQGPTGKQSRTVTIPAGQSDASFVWTPIALGVSVIDAREVNDELLAGQSAVLIRPAPAPARPAAASPAPPKKPARNGRKTVRAVLPSVVPLVFFAQQPAPAAAIFNEPQLLIQISGRASGILANGTDFAQIHVFYTAPEPAEADIRVWFDWKGGWVEPQPAVIKKGELEAVAYWKSTDTAEATLKISNSTPDLPWNESAALHVSFVPPIHHLRIDGAPSMSFLDDGELVVRLEDVSGKAVPSGTRRRISFVSGSAVARVDPAFQEAAPDQSEVRISLKPSSFGGRAQVQASTAGYPPASRDVQITWLLAAIYCLAGGLAGGVIGFFSSRKGTSLPIWLLRGGVIGSVLAAGAELGLFVVFGARIPHGLVLVPILSFLGGGGFAPAMKLGKGVFGVPGGAVSPRAASPAANPSPPPPQPEDPPRAPAPPR